ncbi:MAG TPA: hypothetical protein EYQ24_10295 [Bacteroidetes bacterium]|nr:hypothetical protein [Bacteroidota bacterium]HIL58488.1 hypothetical protein [Rhodothermales bacterium]
MRRPLFLLAILAAPLALAQSASGPDADALYHSAAQAYIGGETEAAVRDAERGLALDPGNAKLERLLELLRQQQPPQDGEQDQDQESDDSDSQDENEPENEQQGDDGPESDDETERDGTQQERQEPNQEADADQGRDDERQRPPSSPSAGGERREMQMSAAEAQRLLDAVAADEELLVERMRRPSRQRRSERDW